MGSGLAIGRPPGWQAWRSTFRLLAVTMPLTIAAVAGLGWWVLGLTPAAAILLGAVLAPTDPVLASDVQVATPGDDADDEVRFALTSKAGLNDGLALPFTNLALLWRLTAWRLQAGWPSSYGSRSPTSCWSVWRVASSWVACWGGRSSPVSLH